MRQRQQAYRPSAFPGKFPGKKSPPAAGFKQLFMTGWFAMHSAANEIATNSQR
jgi:hypothetical protein